jgi:hypothetical protein
MRYIVMGIRGFEPKIDVRRHRKAAVRVQVSAHVTIKGF